MPLATLLMLSAAPDPAVIMDRMKATLSKRFSVKFSISRPDIPSKGTGQFSIERPMHMRFSAKWGADDFETTWTESKAVEFSRTQKVYYESGPFDRLYQPESSISGLPQVSFPLVLLVGDLRPYAERDKPTYAGSESIGGTTCDHLKARGWDAYIAPDGRLLRFRYDAPSGPKTVSATFEFTNYRLNPSFPSATFDQAIPAGFRPFGLPRDPVPLEVGVPFPERDWVANSGAIVAFEENRPFLAVAVASDCEISPKAAKALTTIQKDVAVWLMSDDGKAPAGMNVFTLIKDRAGRTLDRLFAPGTPTFFLVDKTHRVSRVWYGFETDRADAFVSEIKAALAK